MTEHKFSGQHSCFIFGRSLVQISAQGPTILTAVSHSSPPCLHTGKCQNKYLNLGHDQFLPHHLQFSIHKSYYHLAQQSESLTTFLNKPHNYWKTCVCHQSTDLSYCYLLNAIISVHNNKEREKNCIVI